MGKEIEHKYTVNIELLPELTEGIKIIQGYLPTDSFTKTRIRVTSYHDDKHAFLTIKGKNKGATRPEFEYEIPVADGLELIQMCNGHLSKTRHEIEYEGNTWEVDFFDGDNKGLVVAEIEFEEIGDNYFIPEWAIEEICDNRYYNSNLLEHPFKNW